MINQGYVNHITQELAQINATNNLAARIDVLYRFAQKGSLTSFQDEMIYSIRKIAKKNKKTISNKTMIEIEELADYFECILIAEKLDNKR